MFEGNEVTNLVVDLLSVPLVIYVFRNRSLPRYRFLLVALVLMLLSHLLTVLEGVALSGPFNILEHLAMLAAAVCFLIGIFKYFIRGRGGSWTQSR